QQMRDFDRAAVEEYGIPSIVLMENAALRVVEFLEAKFAPLSNKKIVILCGKGNNGGDGLAIARHLLRVAGRLVVVHPDPQTLQGDAATQWHIIHGVEPGAGEFCVEWIDWSQLDLELSLPENPTPEDFAALEQSDFSALATHFADSDVVVDALLGTGLEGELRSPYSSLISTMQSSLNIVSVDISSGISADSGQDLMPPEGRIIGSRYSVTFANPKRGLFLRDGLILSGELWIGEIGSRTGQMARTKTGVETVDAWNAKFLAMRYLKRPLDAHKGDAGRALIIGGSFGMSGAVALAARAALGSGCGLCIAALPEKILPTFAASILEATSHPLPCDERGRLLESAADALPELWEGVQVVALGPGIGRADETFALVRRIARECPTPLIIDADALHALPAIADEVKNRAGETILTPHPGEMGVLLGVSAREVNENRFEIAQQCAQKYGAIVVLKGARSLVATPDGRVFVNLSGNAGMATGGSGDVLTGTIAGLLAQMKHPEDATKLGVYLHGFAGDLAFEEKGNGLVAGDIAAHLGRALVKIPQREVEKINGRLRRLM
ncbi:MAG: NAD(P)H-hydrate dehydratase, partial [Armatimonadetes bacterium]|nr:NAD(P)H-hydrate dehydratase [Armatimonadota bacterium]